MKVPGTDQPDELHGCAIDVSHASPLPLAAHTNVAAHLNNQSAARATVSLARHSRFVAEGTHASSHMHPTRTVNQQIKPPKPST